MKRITSLLLAVMLLALTACQKTPETPIVQEKNVDRLIEKADKASGEQTTNGGQSTNGGKELTEVDLAEKLGVPERYISQKTYPNEKLTLNADAEIILPSYAMPVVRVEPAEFSQEFANKIYDVLIGDETMFEQPEGTISKSDLDNMISDAEQHLLDLQLPYVVVSDEGIESIKSWLADLKGFSENASERIKEPIPVTPDIKTKNLIDWYTGEKYGERTGFELINKNRKFSLTNDGYSYDENGEIKYDAMISGPQLSFSFMSDEKIDIMGEGTRGLGFSDAQGYTPVEIEKANPNDYSERAVAVEFFSYKQALAEVEKFLTDIGIDDMKVSEMTLYYFMPTSLLYEIPPSESGGKGDVTTVINDIRNGKYDDQIADVQIEIKLSRHYNGVPVTSPNSSNGSGSFIIDDSYNQSWPYETFNITVCKEGITGVNWTSPYKIIETVVEDSNIISFDDAVGIFEKMYYIKFAKHNIAFVEDAKRVHNRELEITNDGEIFGVSLSLRRITEQNSTNRGLLVPVWDFYGVLTTTTWENGVAVTKNYFPYGMSPTQLNAPNEPLMSINAIDGTVIDLAKGY